MLVEQVAGSPWNRWPDAHGIRDRITVARAASGNKAILQIGYTTINCHELVPDVLAHFARHTPEIRVQLQYLSAPAQRDKIITGELDGGFVEGSFHSSEIATALVGRHRLMVLMGREHLLSEKATLSVDEIVDQEIIMGTHQDWPTCAGLSLTPFRRPAES